MQVEAKVCIKGSKEEIWQVITDIENSAKTIAAIEKIEILEQPTAGLAGLKWRETRTMFGKSATEVMWITDFKENEFYETRAESHGAIYRSRLQVEEQDGETCLTMEFSGEARTLVSKIMSGIMGLFLKSATRKALQEDLEDIKAAVEDSD